MKKIFFILLLIILILMAVIIKNKRTDHLGWIEETDELRALRDKLETTGYLTNEDLDKIRKIQEDQLDHLNNKAKNK